MKCRHGILGPCAQCNGAAVRVDVLMEMAKLVQQLADDHGLDTSGLEMLVRKLR